MFHLWAFMGWFELGHIQVSDSLIQQHMYNELGGRNCKKQKYTVTLELELVESSSFTLSVLCGMTENTWEHYCYFS